MTLKQEAAICRGLWALYRAGDISNDMLQADLKRIFGSQTTLKFEEGFEEEIVNAFEKQQRNQ